MKQFKLWMVALTILMGASLTSCLESGGEYVPTVGGIYKVNTIYGSTTFKNPWGISVLPTFESVMSVETKMGFKSSSTNVAYIGGTYDQDLQTDEKAYKDVNLTYAVSLDAKVIVTERGAENDSIDGSPIITLDKSQNMANARLSKPWFIDEYTLMLPINYFLSNDGHKFSLMYYPAENEDSETLKLYLRHYNNKDVSTNLQSSDVRILNYSPYAYLFAYDLNEVFSEYRNKTGHDTPTSIEVVTLEKEYDVSLEGATEKVYTIECKPIAEETEK